jgi:hypothetical protein
MNKNKVIFIIAHKYFRGYESYIEYYINNIKKFYEESLIIVVDNNSNYKDDIFDKLKLYDNVILLDNDIECKFEVGAYNVGMKYLIDNDLLNKYDYVTMTQDNFIIKNKLDFNNLYNENVYACPINGCYQNVESKEYLNVQMDCIDVWQPILERLGLNNNIDKISFCWCHSFIIATNKVEQLYTYTKDIVIKIRWESCASERYLARFLWELNDYKNYDIDGDIRDLKEKYDCWSVNLYGDVPTFFAKRIQQKTENTTDT